MTRTVVITENVNSKWRILLRNTHFGQISNFNNFGTLRSWGLKFSGIEHFKIIYKQWKNEQNERGKGVNIQKYWMIWNGITRVKNVAEDTTTPQALEKLQLYNPPKTGLAC